MIYTLDVSKMSTYLRQRKLKPDLHQPRSFRPEGVLSEGAMDERVPGAFAFQRLQELGPGSAAPRLVDLDTNIALLALACAYRLNGGTDGLWALAANERGL